MTGACSSVLRSAKVVSIFKKDSKLVYSNYHPFSLLSNIEKSLKNLCIRDRIPSSITIMLSITYSLDLVNILHIHNILHLML